MGSRATSPLGGVLKGIAAGAVGTGVMTGAQLAYLNATGGEQSSAPAEVGKRIIEGVFRRQVPGERMELLGTVMHWLYGTSWGAAYGVAVGGRRPRVPRAGLACGLVVWGASLVHLPAMGLAPPVWEYEASDLGPDVGFHVVYGAAVAAAFAVLDG